MGNIIKEEKKFSFAEHLLSESEEKDLYAHFRDIKAQVLKSIEVKDYTEVYRILSSFKPYVDSFFDNVLVMDENLELRTNRMGLLKEIIGLFSGIIDFSKIVLPGE